MTIAAAREEKLSWLMRPVNWAYTAATSTAALAVLVWYDGKADTSVLLTIALAGLTLTSGLLLWAIKRIGDAARGRI